MRRARLRSSARRGGALRLYQQLCDLNGIERSALAQVIAGDDEDEALIVIYCLILADAPDQGIVLAGGGEGGGDIGKRYAWGIA